MTLKERSIFRQWTATIRLYEWFWCAVMDTSTSASYCTAVVVSVWLTLLFFKTSRPYRIHLSLEESFH